MIRIYSFSVSIILILTGVGKIWSAFGSVTALRVVDPFFGFEFRYLMLFAGILELIVAGFYFYARNTKLFLYLVAWLATSILTYRLSLEWIGWHLPCSCMGHFTDALHILPQRADNIMKFVLVYFLFGSYSSILYFLKNCQRTHINASGFTKTTELES